MNFGQIQDTDYVRFCGGQAPNWHKAGLVKGAPGARIKPEVGSLSMIGLFGD